MTGAVTDKEFQKLAAITRIHHSFGASLNLEEIARILVRELTDILGCDGCALLLVEGEQVKVIAEGGLCQTLAGLELNADLPPVSYIIQTKQPIFTGDVRHSAMSGCVPEACGVNSLICVPVIIDDAVRGITYLAAAEKDAFTQEDLEFVSILSQEAAIALERSFLYSAIVDLSTRDGLSGCFNRRKFDVDLAAEVANAKQYGRSFSLPIIDIDWFKNYNDFHGHVRGDALLQKLVAILMRQVRPFDKTYRYGGEEFAILLPDTDEEKATIVAKRLLQAVASEPFEGEEKSQPNQKLTVSIGVATFPQDARDGKRLVEAADSALYRAKSLGKNQVSAFSQN